MLSYRLMLFEYSTYSFLRLVIQISILRVALTLKSEQSVKS